MVVALLICTPGHFLWRLAGQSSPWPRLFLGWIGRIAGARVHLSGTPLPARVLFVSNHVSWLDILIVAGATGAAFVSRDDVARWPLIGWLSRLNNTIFVARAGRCARASSPVSLLRCSPKERRRAGSTCCRFARACLPRLCRRRSE
jgi:1-acyl-sn-glycerol-3-phosphate acyltransferase